MKISTALLSLVLVSVPLVASAKYVALPPERLFVAAEHVVVGTISAVNTHTFTVKVESSADTTLPTTIQVQRRNQNRRICAPSDPRGMVVGSRWLWSLNAHKTTYRSWAGAPHPVVAGRVTRLKGFATSKRDRRLQGPQVGPLLKVIKGYRELVAIKGWRIHRRCEPRALEAFAATSDLAATLVRCSKAIEAPPLPPAKPR